MTIIEKMYAGEKLSEKELSALVFADVEDDCEIVTESEGEESRWTRTVDTIIKVGEDYWDIPWERGLTEYQKNAFEEQPFRVKPIKEVITVTRWVPLEETDE